MDPPEALIIDPLGLDDPPLPKEAYAPAALTITGLSDEEDAARHLALRFNPDLRFCPNCETVMVPQPYNWCPYCGDHCREVGTKPRIKKVPAR